MAIQVELNCNSISSVKTSIQSPFVNSVNHFIYSRALIIFLERPSFIMTTNSFGTALPRFDFPPPEPPVISRYARVAKVFPLAAFAATGVGKFYPRAHISLAGDSTLT